MRIHKVPVEHVGLVWNNQLGHMFNRQVELITLLTPIQKLPSLPSDIDNPNNQAFIKELAQCMVEELSHETREIFEKLTLISTKPEQEHTQILGGLTLRALIVDLNEELADVTSFILELLIYLGMDEYLITQKVTEFCDENNFMEFHVEGDVLETLFSLATHSNSFKARKGLAVRTLVPLEGSSFTDPGSRFSPQSYMVVNEISYELISKLSKLTHCLKNRPWRRTMVETNKLEVQHNAMELLATYIELLEFIGYTPAYMQNNYLCKNYINQQRIKENY